MGSVANPVSGVQEAAVASGIDGLAPDIDIIRHQDTLLTAAQLLALRATNIEVVGAPSAGYAAVPVAVHMFLDHGGTDIVQVNNADQLALLYNGGSEIVEIGLAASFTSFIEASADEAFFVAFAEATGAGGETPIAATAIDLDNNGAAEWTTGDGLMSMRVYYKLVPMFRFS